MQCLSIVNADTCLELSILKMSRVRSIAIVNKKNSNQKNEAFREGKIENNRFTKTITKRINS